MGKLFTVPIVYIMVMALSQTVTQTQGQTLNSGAIQRCLSSYMDEVTRLASRISQDFNVLCPAVERYAKCLLNSFGDFLTQDNIKSVENTIETSLSQYGITCDLDLSKMAGSRTDSTSGQSICLKDYLEKASKVTSLSEICPLAERYLECVLKSIPNFQPSESNIRSMEQMLQTIFTQTNVQCQVDVREVVERIQHGNHGVSLFSATWSLRGMVVSLLSVFVIFGLM